MPTYYWYDDAVLIVGGGSGGMMSSKGGKSGGGDYGKSGKSEEMVWWGSDYSGGGKARKMVDVTNKEAVIYNNESGKPMRLLRGRAGGKADKDGLRPSRMNGGKADKNNVEVLPLTEDDDEGKIVPLNLYSREFGNDDAFFYELQTAMPTGSLTVSMIEVFVIEYLSY